MERRQGAGRVGGGGVAGENFSPFAIGGDDNGNLRPFPLSPGAHSVTATAYSGRDGSGSVLGTVTRSFTVIDNADGSPAASVAGSACPK